MRTLILYYCKKCKRVLREDEVYFIFKEDESIEEPGVHCLYCKNLIDIRLFKNKISD